MLSPFGSGPFASFHVFTGTPPAEVSLARYRVPTAPALSDAVLTASRAATAKFAGYSNSRPSVSLSFTVARDTPAVRGVPEIVPSAPSTRPEGSEPEPTAIVYVPLPPEGVSFADKGTPTSHTDGRGGVASGFDGVTASGRRALIANV